MAVLAIEADPRQASALRHIVCDLVKSRLTLVDSIAGAVLALSTETPEMILLPPIISPGDEAELGDIRFDDWLGRTARPIPNSIVQPAAAGAGRPQLKEGEFRIGEVPIIFVERAQGHSKVSTPVLLESLVIPWRLVFRRSP